MPHQIAGEAAAEHAATVGRVIADPASEAEFHQHRREIRSGGGRQGQRAPETAVYLHQAVASAVRIPFEFHHCDAAPAQRRDQPGCSVEQDRRHLDAHPETAAAAGQRHLVQPDVLECIEYFTLPGDQFDARPQPLEVTLQDHRGMLEALPALAVQAFLAGGVADVALAVTGGAAGHRAAGLDHHRVGQPSGDGVELADVRDLYAARRGDAEALGKPEGFRFVQHLVEAGGIGHGDRRIAEPLAVSRQRYQGALGHRDDQIVAPGGEMGGQPVDKIGLGPQRIGISVAPGDAPRIRRYGFVTGTRHIDDITLLYQRASDGQRGDKIRVQHQNPDWFGSRCHSECSSCYTGDGMTVRKQFHPGEPLARAPAIVPHRSFGAVPADTAALARAPGPDPAVPRQHCRP